jgi:hypothetical protein
MPVIFGFPLFALAKSTIGGLRPVLRKLSITQFEIMLSFTPLKETMRAIFYLKELLLFPEIFFQFAVYFFETINKRLQINLFLHLQVLNHEL